MKRTLYAAHQPDLLPYSGFWYKLAKSDIFDLKIWDQYVDRGYQRRVMMRNHWVNLPLVKGSKYESIFNKRLKPGAVDSLVTQIETRYTLADKKPRFWDERAPEILEGIRSITTDQLWVFNLQTMLLIRDWLGIKTPIALSQPVPAHLRGSDGLVATMQVYNTPVTYLSGTGAKVYMGDCKEFTDAGIPVVFSPHQHVTGDSILSVIFDYEDPMSIVLAEKQGEELAPINSEPVPVGAAQGESS